VFYYGLANHDLGLGEAACTVTHARLQQHRRHWCVFAFSCINIVGFAWIDAKQIWSTSKDNYFRINNLETSSYAPARQFAPCASAASPRGQLFITVEEGKRYVHMMHSLTREQEQCNV